MAKKKHIADNRLLHAGETAYFLCEECSSEFAVTLEPKAADGMPDTFDPKRLECCPFCESRFIVVC